MPLTILPGIIQLARSPFTATCIAPRIERSMWPPRIIPKLSARGEVAGLRQLGDGLLAGVDQVGVLLALERERPHAEHAVLALERHLDALAG